MLALEELFRDFHLSMILEISEDWTDNKESYTTILKNPFVYLLRFLVSQNTLVSK